MKNLLLIAETKTDESLGGKLLRASRQGEINNRWKTFCSYTSPATHHSPSMQTLKGKLFYYYAILSGIAPIALGLSTNLYISLFATVLMGLGQAGYMIISHTIIQMMSPDYVRGRIAGVYAMYIGGSMASFNFLNGLSADFIDPGYSLAIQGIFFTLIVIIYRNQNVLSSIYSGNTKEITSYSKI